MKDAKQYAHECMNHVHRQITRPEMELEATRLFAAAIAEARADERARTVEEAAQTVERLLEGVAITSASMGRRVIVQTAAKIRALGVPR